MNPYDFARIDWERKPERRKPVWHNRLVGTQGQKLYSGQLEVDLDVLTPLFIVDPRDDPAEDREPAHSIQNDYGEYIIPGSSLKGMLRTLVETLGNGCLTLFGGEYDRRQIDYRNKIAPDFRHCRDNTSLCISCRTFGMLQEREGRGNVFLGKVNIGDAIAHKNDSVLYQPIYTGVLVEPKPRHKAFYLDESEQHIAGRKFYFHHSPNGKPITANGLQFMGGKPSNRYIQPLAKGTRFHFRIDFTNLEEDEFGALLLAVVLEETMRHKLGYGKPLGMGSVELYPTKLTLIDYSTRYTQWKAGQGRQEVEDIWAEINHHLNIFYDKHLQTLAMEDLRRIWRFPPEPGVNYYYPSKKEWFDKPISKGKRIADTRSVPRQM
ncbi:MAG TPA: RAMP superfamily CRISPR-associated protein [Ktedonobacteraceae bacterium]|jgi:CRISPR/Cas system CSM-associated protein Csm3 (group 7 of RAMP superfamily)|nr:RAMP superfamily CRISPR-associated protein [Ktedonobacteraceae bacterium]